MFLKESKRIISVPPDIAGNSVGHGMVTSSYHTYRQFCDTLQAILYVILCLFTRFIVSKIVMPFHKMAGVGA